MKVERYYFILIAGTALILLVVWMCVPPQKTKQSQESVTEHTLSSDTEVPTTTGVKVLDDAGNEVTVTDSVVKDTAASDKVTSSDSAVEANVQESESMAGDSADDVIEESTGEVVMADVNVDIPRFGSDSDSSDSKFKGKAYMAQTSDTTSVPDVYYKVNKGNMRVELANDSKTYYKIWSVYTNSGDLLFSSDMAAPLQSIVWDVPSSYLDKDYIEFRLVTTFYDTDSTESAVTSLRSKIKIEVEG